MQRVTTSIVLIATRLLYTLQKVGRGAAGVKHFAQEYNTELKLGLIEPKSGVLIIIIEGHCTSLIIHQVIHVPVYLSQWLLCYQRMVQGKYTKFVIAENTHFICSIHCTAIFLTSWSAYVKSNSSKACSGSSLGQDWSRICIWKHNYMLVTFNYCVQRKKRYIWGQINLI